MVAPPGIITGSSRAKNDGATLCVQGDEATVVVTTGTYSTITHTTPGTGILTIVSMGPDQIAWTVHASANCVPKPGWL